MSRANDLLERWGPAFGLMLVIFGFSSIPSAELPNFGSWDYAVKKGAHAIGYGLLGLLYWRGLGMRRASFGPAWILCLLYSISDEVHLSVVPGRHASTLDVGIDALGAGLALTLAFFRRRATSDD